MEATQVFVHFARKVRLTLQLLVWQWLNYMAGCVPEFQFDLVMSSFEFNLINFSQFKKCGRF